VHPIGSGNIRDKALPLTLGVSAPPSDGTTSVAVSEHSAQKNGLHVLAFCTMCDRRNDLPTTDGQTLIIQRSITGLAVVGMCAFAFRLGLGHVRTSFSLAIVLRAWAVVDVGRGI
jgi:hypothetical protein